MGCIGMGQAPGDRPHQPAHLPAQLPRPLRHAEDHVYLCCPETAAASALTGGSPTRATCGRSASLPALRAAGAAESSTPRCWCRRCRRRGAPGRAGEGPEHRVAARLRAAARRVDAPGRCSRSATTSPPTRSCRRARGCCRSAATSREIADSPSTPIDDDLPRPCARAADAGGHVDRRRRQLRAGLEPGARRASRPATSGCAR